MKILKRLVIIVAGLVVAGVVGGLLMPGQWQVERRLQISAAPEFVYPYLVDLPRWQEWTAWNAERDPQARWSFSGPAREVGYTMEWEGPKMGRGKLVLSELVPNEEVQYRLSFDDQSDFGAGRFVLARNEKGTEVVWTDSGALGFSPLRRLMGPVLQRMLAQDFEHGLTGLQSRAESDASAQAAQ